MLKQHRCRLTTVPVETTDRVIDSGVLINMRRNCLSKTHPRTSLYFKSNMAINKEEMRHLFNYNRIIHPFSKFSLYWEFFIFIVYTMAYLLALLTSVDSTISSIKFLASMMKLITDGILTLDILKTFFTGYYDKDLNRTILKPSSIATKYLKGYFLVDLLMTFQLCAVFVIAAKMRVTILMRYLFRLIYLLKIIRIGRWLDALELFSLYADLSSFSSYVLRTSFSCGVCLIWTYAVIFQFTKAADVWNDVKYDIYSSFKSFHTITLMLLHASYGPGEDTPLLDFQILGTLLIMSVGYCLQMYIFSLVLETWLKFSSTKNKNEGLFQEFNQYLKHKDLPTTLKEKFFSFYQFKFQNQFYNETLINKTLSKILKQDILVYVTKSHVQKVEFFKDLPDTVLAKLVSRLKSEIFLANDIILTAGVAGNCMFFIYFGTVAIFSPGGNEICHLKDGAHFGEIALIFNEPRVATVRAVTPCELFTLNRSDFSDVLEPYPDIKNKITLLALERLNTTTEKSMV
ncbi:hypothetical protein JTB14_034766 [Gonioctena quinquepunctata]|nr:hypothetical protein JTB14_034766 [Gonioctena quinquepunctata]